MKKCRNEENKMSKHFNSKARVCKRERALMKNRKKFNQYQLTRIEKKRKKKNRQQTTNNKDDAENEIDCWSINLVH